MQMTGARYGRRQTKGSNPSEIARERLGSSLKALCLGLFVWRTFFRSPKGLQEDGITGLNGHSGRILDSVESYTVGTGLADFGIRDRRRLWQTPKEMTQCSENSLSRVAHPTLEFSIDRLSELSGSLRSPSAAVEVFSLANSSQKALALTPRSNRVYHRVSWQQLGIFHQSSLHQLKIAEHASLKK
jgi:hypothetical protein